MPNQNAAKSNLHIEHVSLNELHRHPFNNCAHDETELVNNMDYIEREVLGQPPLVRPMPSGEELASSAVPAKARLTERLTFLSINEGDEKIWTQEVVALSGERGNRVTMREQIRKSIRKVRYNIAVEAAVVAKRLANLHCCVLGR